jgi:hypothetical protein
MTKCSGGGVRRTAGARGDEIPMGLDGRKPKSSGGGVPAGRQGRRRAPYWDQAEVREVKSISISTANNPAPPDLACVQANPEETQDL